MANTSVTLRDGESATVGIVTSRTVYTANVGTVGPVGANGVGISSAVITTGNLVLTYSNSAVVNLGNITANGDMAYSNAISYSATDATSKAATAYSNAVSSAAALYQTTAGLSANIATLTSNNANFLGGTAAASYALLSGATFSGAVSGITTLAAGNTTITGDMTVSGNLTINGTTTNINSTNLVVEDKNIILADVTTPTEVTANGGGITLKGATDKTFNWVNATASWTSSENLDLASDKTYKINGTTIANSTALGTGILASSLTSVGTLSSLTLSGAVSGITTLAAGNTTITGKATFGGTSVSAPAWSTNGIGIKQAATTYTDNSTTVAGPGVTTAYMNLFDTATYDSSIGTALDPIYVPTVYGNYFKEPVITDKIFNLNKYAVGIDTLNVTGTSKFDGNITFNGSLGAIVCTSITGVGAASINGTLGVTGITTLTGAASGLVVTVGTASFTVVPTTAGLITLGSTTGTGNITVGQSTRNQTVQIASAATTSGNTKTINIGTGGAAGSTTNVNIGSTLSNTFVTINANTVTYTGAVSGITTLTTSSYAKTNATVVASLVAAATAGAGARSFVTDSTVAASGNFGAIVAGTGANPVPVYSDGTNWRIG